ncbi:MAG: hypothetical protein LC770_00860 [Acidobacteria bacterium]|nr:hypothetical protein [Acidobacteriota bacterium]
MKARQLGDAEMGYDLNVVLMIQAVHWDRGRPHPAPSGALTSQCDQLTTQLALRARGGRDARGPSEELEWLKIRRY